MRRTLAAAVLLLVALVGAGWAWDGGKWHYERRILNTVEYADGITATTEVMVPVLDIPTEDPCAHGDHDWQDTRFVMAWTPIQVPEHVFGLFIGVGPAVRLQTCSRCGILRVRP